MRNSDDERPVETVVAELREGMVQQRALLAGMEEKAGLQELERKCHIDEPVAVPPARLRFLGGVIVWLRKAVYHGVIKWCVRPARFRQNEFNRLSQGLDLFQRTRQILNEVDSLLPAFTFHLSENDHHFFNSSTDERKSSDKLLFRCSDCSPL